MAMFDRREWRGTYNTLTMLNHLLVNGPLSVFNEFQDERELIEDAINTEWIDERGFDCGLKVRNVAEKVLRLLEDGMFFKDERERNRKQSIGRIITGFGNSSFVDIQSETNNGRDSSVLSDHQTCENDRAVDDHPFVEDEHNTAKLLLSSST
uniref:ENTH domain-containing protein n=1 Tax=Noccaea caerulescens TaxID=107243 RepID=A0A1J3F962_NOCCA